MHRKDTKFDNLKQSDKLDASMNQRAQWIKPKGQKWVGNKEIQQDRRDIRNYKKQLQTEDQRETHQEVIQYLSEATRRQIKLKALLEGQKRKSQIRKEYG